MRLSVQECKCAKIAQGEKKENSPTKVGAQFLRHQLRTEVRSMVCFCCAINIHATGFSQWLMTNFSERRIHSASGRANLPVSQI